jgi:hypothetical protein
VATLLVFAAVDFVLILRGRHSDQSTHLPTKVRPLTVYALYHNSPFVRKSVLAAFSLEVTVMAVGLGLALPTIRFDDICVVNHISGTLLLYA